MATTAKQIYRGMNERKETVSNLKVVGAYLPGTFCTASATTLTQTSSGVGTGRLFLLANREFMGQSITDAYASGDTAVAYNLEAGDDFIARFDAATYTYGQELAIGTNGRLKAAATGNVVFATYTGSGVALSAGDFDDFRVIANTYVKA